MEAREKEERNLNVLINPNCERRCGRERRNSSDLPIVAGEQLFLLQFSHPFPISKEGGGMQEERDLFIRMGQHGLRRRSRRPHPANKKVRVENRTKKGHILNTYFLISRVSKIFETNVVILINTFGESLPFPAVSPLSPCLSCSMSCFPFSPEGERKRLLPFPLRRGRNGRSVGRSRLDMGSHPTA